MRERNSRKGATEEKRNSRCRKQLLCVMFFGTSRPVSKLLVCRPACQLVLAIWWLMKGTICEAWQQILSSTVPAYDNSVTIHRSILLQRRRTNSLLPLRGASVILLVHAATLSARKPRRRCLIRQTSCPSSLQATIDPALPTVAELQALLDIAQAPYRWSTCSVTH